MTIHSSTSPLSLSSCWILYLYACCVSQIEKKRKAPGRRRRVVCVAKEEEADTLSTYIYGECGKKEKGRKEEEESVCVKTLEKNSISLCVCVCV